MDDNTEFFSHVLEGKCKENLWLMRKVQTLLLLQITKRSNKFASFMKVYGKENGYKELRW